MSDDGSSPSSGKFGHRAAVFVIVLFALVAVTGVAITSIPPAGKKDTVAPAPVPANTAQAQGTLPSVNEGTPAATKTKLVFSDEFNGPKLDTQKWNTGRYAPTTQGDAPFNPQIENAYYASSQVTQSDGNVVLTTVPSKATLDGKTYNYVSGLIQSENHYYVTPGTYVEARVKVNTCDGCWGAFWAQPSKRWPPEIDIFEFFQPKSRPEYNFHDEAGTRSIPVPYGESNFSYLDHYHVYGVYWDGVQATPYLDGKPYQAQASKTDVPLYLIFNLAIFDGHAPAMGSSMSIDWVRVWR